MNIFFQIVSMIPTLIQLVKAAEDAIPVSGKGKDKLDFVLGVIGDTMGDVGSLIPAITKIVARIVGLFNKTGQFETKQVA